MKCSPLFIKNYESSAHVVINQGGSSSGKTFAILQVLFCFAVGKPNQVITVAGQDIPNLKVGAMRDASDIMALSPELKAMLKNHNKTERCYEFINGSILEFKSYADAQDAKSGKRDYLFINEANGITWEVYHELSLRTRVRTYIDYNPNSEFWVHEKLLNKQGVDLFISDHRHNPFAQDNIKFKIESLHAQDYELWKVYARGLTGRITGLIFTNWYMCDAIPADAKLIAAGLDFGFTNDETGCLLVYKQNGELWLQEVLYKTGLTNTDISSQLKAAGINTSTEIVADSAEPKSIEELRRLGWYISPAKKGPDSVVNSIDILKRYRLNVTRDSTNLKKELGMYKWRTDRSGKAINEPVDVANHLIDPLRYVALNKLNIRPAAGKTKSRLSHLPAPESYGLLTGML